MEAWRTKDIYHWTEEDRIEYIRYSQNLLNKRDGSYYEDPLRLMIEKKQNEACKNEIAKFFKIGNWYKLGDKYFKLKKINYNDTYGQCFLINLGFNKNAKANKQEFLSTRNVSWLLEQLNNFEETTKEEAIEAYKKSCEEVMNKILKKTDELVQH